MACKLTTPLTLIPTLQTDKHVPTASYSLHLYLRKMGTLDGFALQPILGAVTLD